LCYCCSEFTRHPVAAVKPFAAIAALLLAAAPVAAQGHAHPPDSAGVRLRVSAQAIPLVTHTAPALGGESRTEVQVTQPMVMAHATAWGGRAALVASINLEALTLADGEPNPGIWGEGFIDRRHPHTVLHEAVATFSPLGGPHARGELSVSAGRGFVPFGSDDPMARPFVKFPVNHHLAQVLERLMAEVAVRRGPVTVEGALFAGNEPLGTGDLGDPGRFGDSWAVRATLAPRRGWEASGGYARINSPEEPRGLGLDHHKLAASLRYEADRGAASRDYALVEWARTDELNGSLRSFRLSSVLAEGAVRRRGIELALRLERTERPEEERLANPFRTPSPHADVSLLGITRWTIATLHLSHGAGSVGGVRVRPFVEAARLAAEPLRTPTVFVPRDFYGSDRMWTVAAGARIELGGAHPRMGRYGAARGH
jgi:hypothetical protein